MPVEDVRSEPGFTFTTVLEGRPIRSHATSLHRIEKISRGTKKHERQYDIHDEQRSDTNGE